MPKIFYKIARKERNGDVTLWSPGEYGKPATHYATFDRYASNKPDYRFRRVVVNGFEWVLMWNKKR